MVIKELRRPINQRIGLIGIRRRMGDEFTWGFGFAKILSFAFLDKAR